jgi:protein-tyrosine phosphatase
MIKFSNMFKKQVVKINSEQVKVLFVCMGNICRSPTAHGVFQSLVDAESLSEDILVDSAGLHSFHVGNPPDLRSQAAARGHGVELSHLRARQFVSADFMDFDFLLAMDESNYSGMQRLQPESPRGRLSMMLEHSSKYGRTEIPDPYYGDDGFELVYDMAANACAGLLATIRQQNNI